MSTAGRQVGVRVGRAGVGSMVCRLGKAHNNQNGRRELGPVTGMGWGK